MTKTLSPAMISALYTIGVTGSADNVRTATLSALIKRGLVWDESGAWYLTSEAHDLGVLPRTARDADLDRASLRLHREAETAAEPVTPELFDGVQVMIDHAETPLPLATDEARDVMHDAGVDVYVVRAGLFEGTYWAVVEKAWYDRFVASGRDFVGWTVVKGMTYNVTVPLGTR